MNRFCAAKMLITHLLAQVLTKGFKHGIQFAFTFVKLPDTFKGFSVHLFLLLSEPTDRSSSTQKDSMAATNVNKKHGIKVIHSGKRIPGPRMAKRLLTFGKRVKRLSRVRQELIKKAFGACDYIDMVISFMKGIAVAMINNLDDESFFDGTDLLTTAE